MLSCRHTAGNTGGDRQPYGDYTHSSVEMGNALKISLINADPISIYRVLEISVGLGSRTDPHESLP